MKNPAGKIKKIFSIITLVLFMFGFVNVPVAADAVTITPAAPSSVRAVSSSYNSINISWGGVTGASGYAVYRATSSTGTYSLLTRTTARSYTNTYLTTGKTYYYKVRAYRISGTIRIYGSYSYRVSAKPVPSTPTSVRAVSSSYNSINISWGGVTGASGYAVYRATSSTGYYILLTRTTARSYTNTYLTTGKTYYYKIRAYRTVGTTRIYGSYSSASSAKPIPSPPSAKVTSTTSSSISIGWGGVSGASGYEVYKAASSAGTYSIVLSTYSLSYTNTSLPSAKTYYYKVRAYRTVSGVKIYGSFSSVVSGTTAAIKVTSVSLNKTTDSLSVGGIDTLTAVVSPSNATNKSIKWTTSNSAVASVDSTGKVTAVSAGTAIITAATVDGGKTASCTVTVNNPVVNVTSVSLNRTTDTITAGNIDTLTATVNPSNATNKSIKWTTSNSAVASVDSTGKVTAISAGTATITAATLDGGKTASCTVTVPIVYVSSISLNRSICFMPSGNSDTLIANLNPDNATNQNVNWASSDENIATVDNTGNVTAISVGTATITATTADGDKTATCNVNVIDQGLKGIDVSKWQGNVDWSLVKSDGVQFAMIRSSFGDGTSSYSNNGADSMFETNYAAAKANGIAVGAYHYSYAETVDEATAEANFFISRLSGRQFEYPVVVDIEDQCQNSLDQKTLTDIALVYLNMLKQAGYYPMIYCNKYWFTSKLDDTALATYDHWLAQWGNSYTYTGKVGLWQHTSSGTVKGISGNVDMDISFEDYASKIKSLNLNGF